MHLFKALRLLYASLKERKKVTPLYINFQAELWTCFFFSFLVILFVCHSQRMVHAASFFRLPSSFKRERGKKNFSTTTLKLVFVITHFLDIYFQCSRAGLLCYDFSLPLCNSLLMFLTCVCVCVCVCVCAADGVPWRH